LLIAGSIRTPALPLSRSSVDRLFRVALARHSPARDETVFAVVSGGGVLRTTATARGLALNEATARSCRIGAADRARPGHHDRKAAPDSGLMLPVTCLARGLMRPG
jgi:hypothetical protein